MPAINRVLLHCGVFIYLAVLLNGQTTYNIIVVEDKISNGRDGVCKVPKANTLIGQSCTSRWRVQNQTSGPKIQLTTYAGCRYSIKTTIQNCLGPNSFGALRSETCVRKQTYYYMVASCMRRWLEWEACDKSCGGGLSRRYKFQQISLTKYYDIETRACNTHPCPHWSPWQPSETACDVNCTRLWTRSCRNGTSVLDAAKCAGTTTSNSVVERRPCYVSMCKNFVQLLPSTTSKPTTLTPSSSTTTTTTVTPTTTSTTTTTKAPTTTTTTVGTRTKPLPGVRVIVLPKINQTRPGVLLKPRLNEDSVTTEKRSGEDSNVLVWIGVLVGVLAFCILVLLTYIGMQKYRKGKLSVLPFRSFQSTTTSQATSQNSGGAAAGARSTSNQYHSSSIDRLIARVRALQQMATMRRNSPSSVYLQPDVPGQNGTPQFAHNSSVRSVAFAENAAASYSAVPSAEERANNAGDPIYADIPAYRNNSNADDFTSDSDFDQLDEEPTTSSVSIPNGRRLPPPREYSGSFVARQDPGGVVRGQLRRCETERRGPLHEEIRRLGGVRPVPRPQAKRSSLPNYMRHGVAPGSTGWNQAFGEFSSDSPYTRPLKRRSRMGSVAESSREDLSVIGRSSSSIMPNRNSYPPHEASPVYLAPDIPRPEASDRTREPLPPQPVAENNNNTVSVHPKASEGYSGSYNASHEFGFQRTPVETRSARNSASSVRSTTDTSAERDDYREPIDANRPAVNEAYTTYNVPFEPRVPP